MLVIRQDLAAETIRAVIKILDYKVKHCDIRLLNVL
jgi:hypothetical protein